MASKRVLDTIHVLELLENDPDSCDFEEEFSDSDYEEEIIEETEHNSDSEQELSDDNGESDDDEIPVKRILLAKTGATWQETPFRSNVRRSANNIITTQPGPIGAAKNAKTPLDIFSFFMTPAVIAKITDHTNQKIEKIKDRYSSKYDVTATTTSEILAMLGILVISGAQQASRHDIADLWKSDGTGMDLLRSVMTYKRFKFLLCHMRFDDSNTREERRLTDRLAPIRNIFESVVGAFRQMYSPTEHLTLDEALEAFRGRCCFVQYMPKKPAKYGIKLQCLCEAKTNYICNMEVYVGKQPEGPFQLSNKPHDITLRMVSPIVGTGKNLTTDNWYTSVPLAEDLLKKKVTLVGTMRKNKPDIPPEMMPNKNRKLLSSQFGFQKEMMMVSYVPKPKKAVMLLSTIHSDASIDETTRDKQKPSVVTFYNETKGGVDTADEKCAATSCSRRTNRWPMSLFYFLVNKVCLNSFVIYVWNNDEDGLRSRREFLRRLGKELLREQLELRLQSRTGIQRALQNTIERCASSMGIDIPSVSMANQEDVRTKARRIRCAYCKGNDRKTSTYCYKCTKPICKEHQAPPTCKDCVE